MVWSSCSAHALASRRLTERNQPHFESTSLVVLSFRFGTSSWKSTQAASCSTSYGSTMTAMGLQGQAKSASSGWDSNGSMDSRPYARTALSGY